MVVAAFAAATTFACSGAEPESRVDAEFAERLDRDVVRAEESGASAEQLETLASAEALGEVTFEAYSESVDRALRCLREAGVVVQDAGVFEHLGLRLRSYVVPSDAEAADQREPLPGFPVHRCIAEHSFWVERLYQLQPTSLEAQEAHFERFRGAIVECLARYGVEVEPDLSHRELSTLFRDPGSEETQTYGRCLDESGFSRS